jgi:hypothetical protein
MTTTSDRCPDCGVAPGEFHATGCDIEQCPYCGHQLLACKCEPRPPLDDRLPWGGVWPGADACRRFGWFARLVPGRGWVPCGAGDEGAVEDLNRLHLEAMWDREGKRFVLRGRSGSSPPRP